jgi:hypothetical protein
MQTLLHILKDNLSMATNCMKQQANQHHSKQQFAVGDMVFVRLQTYKQGTPQKQGNQELPPQCYGRYKVCAKARELAYIFDISNKGRLHDIFHASSIEMKVSEGIETQIELTLTNKEGKLILESKGILEEQVQTLLREKIAKYKMKWKGLDEEEATWEVEAFMGSTQICPPWNEASFPKEASIKRKHLFFLTLDIIMF